LANMKFNGEGWCGHGLNSTTLAVDYVQPIHLLCFALIAHAKKSLMNI